MCDDVRAFVDIVGVCTYLRLPSDTWYLVVDSVENLKSGVCTFLERVALGFSGFETGDSTRLPTRIGVSAYCCCMLLLIVLLLFAVCGGGGGFAC